MTFQQFLDSIPIEGWAAVGLAFASMIAGIFLFFRWLLFTYIPRVLEDKVKAGEEKRQEDAKEAEAKRQLELLDIQNQLDATQSARQMNIMLMSEMAESRKESDKRAISMQEAFARRDEQYAKHLETIGETLHGFQAVAASNLELLKNHIGTDEAMAKNTEIVKDQNEVTHRKLIEMASTLDAIAQNLTSLSDSVNQKADKSVLSDLLLKLEAIQEGIKQLEENTKPMPAISETTTPKVNFTENTISVTESSKEYSQTSDESKTPK